MFVDARIPSTFTSVNADTTHLFADDQHLATAGQKIVAGYIYNLLVQTVPMNISNSDCLFNWGQQDYASLLSPPAASQVFPPYYYRYYTATNIYVGVSSADGHLYALSNGQLFDEGQASAWYATSGCQ